MFIEGHLDIIRQGVTAWNKWRKIDPDTDPDLRWADLNIASLSKVNFSKTDLSGASLCGGISRRG